MSQYYNRPLEFRVMRVFSDNMVLQRDKNIHIFGEGENGTEVVVTLVHADGTTVTATTIAENEKWLAILPPQKGENGCRMTVEAYQFQDTEEEKVCIAKLTYENVAIGEVWLAGGQSNMELELQNCTGGLDTLKQDKNPNVRFYYTQKRGYKNREFFEAEEKSGWEEFGEENARIWSAVGYYFAKYLSQDLEGITVGVLGCNWGGTSASAWMSREALLEDKDTASYVTEFEEICKGLSVEEQEEAYDAYAVAQAEYDQKCDALSAAHPEFTWAEIEAQIGPNRWPGPMGIKNPYRPAGLYECMLQRVCPYSMRGFLYYQGESDEHKPRMYYKLMTRMIRQWREDFLDEEMPFLLVQLPMHQYLGDEDFKHWPIIREAQMDTYKTIKNTGIAVIIDRGEFNEIHPKDKVTVGKRLELQALAQVYGKLEKKDAFAPLYDTCIYYEDAIELCFKYAQDGFTVKGELAGFEVAGADKEFVKAKAKIDGDRIFVSAKEVVKPVYARYLWTNYAEVTLYGVNGLPVAPFRTNKKDEKSLELKFAKIQQIMEV